MAERQKQIHGQTYELYRTLTDVASDATLESFVETVSDITVLGIGLLIWIEEEVNEDGVKSLHLYCPALGNSKLHDLVEAILTHYCDVCSDSTRYFENSDDFLSDLLTLKSSHGTLVNEGRKILIPYSVHLPLPHGGQDIVVHPVYVPFNLHQYVMQTNRDEVRISDFTAHYTLDKLFKFHEEGISVSHNGNNIIIGDLEITTTDLDTLFNQDVGIFVCHTSSANNFPSTNEVPNEENNACVS